MDAAWGQRLRPNSHRWTAVWLCAEPCFQSGPGQNDSRSHHKPWTYTPKKLSFPCSEGLEEAIVPQGRPQDHPVQKFLFWLFFIFRRRKSRSCQQNDFCVSVCVPSRLEPTHSVLRSQLCTQTLSACYACLQKGNPRKGTKTRHLSETLSLNACV